MSLFLTQGLQFLNVFIILENSVNQVICISLMEVA